MASPPFRSSPAAWVPYQRFSDLLFVSVAGHLAFAVFFGLFRGQPLIGACLGLSSALVGVLFPLMRSSVAATRVRVIAHAALFANMLLVMVSLIWMGQSPAASVWWLVWWPMFVAHVLGWRDGVAWVPVTLLAAAAMWWHGLHPVLQPHMDASELPMPLLQVGFLLIGCGVGLVVRRAYEGYQRDIGRQQATIRAQQMELTEHTTQLEDMLQALQQANLERTRLFAQLSHEVRTPLNGVLGFAQLLGQTPLSEAQSRHLTQINQCGATLLQMVNEVLDFSRMEERTTRVEKVPFDLLRVAHEAMDMVLPVALAKGVTLHMERDLHEGELVGDPLRIKQVMLNLLANAVKFTSVGDVTLRCRMEAPPTPGAAPEQAWLHVEVQDCGIGVPASALPHLFEPFCEASDRTIARYGGSGLGLAICKRLVDAMGGRIGASSQPGQGSLFWFSVPVSGGLPESPSPRNTHQDTVSAQIV
jgi:signal transduction histidine kinase